MKTSEFVVPVADLERGPKELTWPVPRKWLELALEGTEATPADNLGELRAELTKNGREVMVRGHVRVPLSMPCARTLEPVPVEVSSDIFLLLAQASPVDQPGRPVRRKERAATAGNRRPGAPVASQKQRAGGWAADPVLTEDDAARDTYSGEQIVLDPFVREFILLELPMFPMQKGLPSEQTPIIAPSSAEEAAERPIDPRLLPLAELASRLRNKE